MSKLTGERAFNILLDRLMQEEREHSQARAEVMRLRHDIQQQTLLRASAQEAQKRAEADLKATRENYEKLKKATPAKVLAEHERAIDDIPF